MIKVSQMKNVKPFTCDSFVIDEEYVCVKTTYNRLAERIRRVFTSNHAQVSRPRCDCDNSDIRLVCTTSRLTAKDVVFNKTRDSRGCLPQRKPDNKISCNNEGSLNRQVSMSHILVSKNEWHTN